MTEYRINVFWSDEDRSWVADIPDLAKCSVLGDTPEEAVHEVLVSKQAWIESAMKHGDRIPEPRYRPAIYAVP
jgi:predicted RNase H-like HicB family nuclease